MSDRRVPPGGGILIGLVLGIMLWLSLAAIATAQAPTEQKFLVAVDTAGIAATGPNTYATWVYALSTPTSFPSSGILVEWDCTKKQVRRIAQVKYRLNADSSGVEGPVQMVNGPWMPISNSRMFALVCSVGPQHEAGDAWKREAAPQEKAWDGKSFDA
jgi:hypothetical protein